MTITRDQALAKLRSGRNRGRGPAERSWPCRIGPVLFRFRNFAWRQKAIEAHDLHHLMTGYPMTMRGEFQLAAWEFGGGRYPHWGATLFCAPLLLAGFLWSPRRMLKAMKDGRRTGTLYPENQS